MQNAWELYQPHILVTVSFKNLIKQLQQNNVEFKKVNLELLSFRAKLIEDGPEMDLRVFHQFGKIKQIQATEQYSEPNINVYDSVQKMFFEKMGKPKSTETQRDFLDEFEKACLWETEDFIIEHHFFHQEKYYQHISIRFAREEKKQKRSNKRLSLLISGAGGIIWGLLMYAMMGIEYGFGGRNFLICIGGGGFFGVVFYILFFLVFKAGGSNPNSRLVDRRLRNFENTFAAPYMSRLIGYTKISDGHIVFVRKINIYFFNSSITFLSWNQGKYLSIHKSFSEIDKVAMTLEGIAFLFCDGGKLYITMTETEDCELIVRIITEKKSLLAAFES